MRIMPFMKRKKGIQFAGVGLDTGGGGSLPIASENTLGGVKIGAGLSITSEGVVSASGGVNYSLNHVKIGKYFDDDLYMVSYRLSASKTLAANNWVDLVNDAVLSGCSLVKCDPIVNGIDQIPLNCNIRLENNKLFLMNFGSAVTLQAGTVITFYYSK